MFNNLGFVSLMPTASWLALHSEIPKIARPSKNSATDAKIPKIYC
ncbi:MAG: hypothetical protein UW37_C0041G0009 [Candidatus Gottesmanbacteria bacterium GW2011_GWA2_44_17]|uniref:Uncharacterized protein n=1 Tax=Candidatus Gottesmanbacteria bacterium GW2011_GWA2_44_17 TaxID=1618444 RepID=A0A0G1KDA5_9BACT|nr:MAG: hypothetical protein UW37_C0041G0009 [Candidatus Gottesmanbacteria bacterium GW2011_GWA2_44_17]